MDDGPVEHWGFECAGEYYQHQYTSPIGYLFVANAPNDPHGLKVTGCKSAAVDSQGVSLYAFDAAGVGEYMTGAPKYQDGNGMVTGVNNDPFDMVVTTFGPLGEPIDGTFTATSTTGNISHTLMGSFHVCHAPTVQ